MEKDPITRIEEKVDHILNILNGNGDVGLCAKVSILWKTSVFLIAGVVLAIIRSFF